MSNSKKIFTSKTDDTLLVRDPNQTLRSRVINNKTDGKIPAIGIGAAKVSVSNTSKASESILKKVEIKDVALGSGRDKLLKTLSMGAKKDLLDNLKRLLPAQFSAILDDAEGLLGGKKQLIDTASGSRWYGLEEIGYFGELIELSNQWERYQKEKKKEKYQSTFYSSDSILAGSMLDKYIKLDDPVGAITFLDSLEDPTMKVYVAKIIFLVTAYESKLTLVRYLIPILSATFINKEYPDIISILFSSYRDTVWEEGKDNLVYLLEVCHLIKPNFIVNSINESFINLDIMRSASKDIMRVILNSNPSVEEIIYEGGSISRNTLLVMVETSRRYRTANFLKEIDEGFPYILNQA